MGPQIARRQIQNFNGGYFVYIHSSKNTIKTEVFVKQTILIVILLGLLSFGLVADEKEDFAKGQQLYKEGKFAESLALINDGIKKYGETENWLTGKFYILMEMKKYEEAIEVGVKKENITTRKSPYSSYELAELYMEVKKPDEALKWLETSVERGFQDYTEMLGDEKFQPLFNDKRFVALTDKIKLNIGIGKPVKEFALTSLTGEPVSVAKYKGKVVLLDFWATWCSPCVHEMPNVKKIYDQYHAKGFEIIGISLDNAKEKLTEYIKTQNIQWLITFSGKGWGDDTAALYGVRSIPSTWVLDKKGMLRYFGIRGDELGKAIEKLLAE
jgi:peroxiredoxin